MLAFSAAVGRAGRFIINFDARSEIRARLLDQAHQIVELIAPVRIRVASHDHPAASPDQFIHGQVLEMPAIREIDISLLLIAVRNYFRE